MAVVLAGCATTEVSEGDINSLSAKHSEAAYDEAMKKAGRGDELAEQKRIEQERQDSR